MVGSDAPAAKRIEAVYPLVFARKPNAAEIQWGETHLKEQLRIYVAANEPVPQASAKAFLSLAQMLLSSNEFLYVD